MMKGELISLVVAVSWTVTALFAEVASKRMGSLPLNVVRMLMSLSLLALSLWVTLGVPFPPMADGATWLWLSLSGFVGYVLGDYCLFQSYVVMNSRFGQLFMTLSSPTAAITALLLLGETMQPLAIVGMIVTLVGIGMSILSKGDADSKRRVTLKMPLRGVLFGVGAGMGQGIGMVLSKVGMQHYEASIAQCGYASTADYVNAGALFPLPLDMMMPFASTMIRAIIGLIGFSVALMCFTHHGGQRLQRAVTDSRGMWAAMGAAFFGPFFGVSLSLMAMLYTSAGIAQTIMAMTPVFIILPSWLLFHQRVTWLEVMGAMISVVGVTLFFI